MLLQTLLAFKVEKFQLKGMMIAARLSFILCQFHYTHNKAQTVQLAWENYNFIFHFISLDTAKTCAIMITWVDFLAVNCTRNAWLLTQVRYVSLSWVHEPTRCGHLSGSSTGCLDKMSVSPSSRSQFYVECEPIVDFSMSVSGTSQQAPSHEWPDLPHVMFILEKL